MNDALGSVTATLSTTGTLTAAQLFAPYGGSHYSTGTMPTSYGFTGQRSDGSGLEYFHARYYDPAVGQFTSADPVQGVNRYAYVGGNPETATDPTGNDTDPHAAYYAEIRAKQAACPSCYGLPAATSSQGHFCDSCEYDESTPNLTIQPAPLPFFPLCTGGISSKLNGERSYGNCGGDGNGILRVLFGAASNGLMAFGIDGLKRLIDDLVSLNTATTGKLDTYYGSFPSNQGVEGWYSIIAGIVGAVAGFGAGALCAVLATSTVVGAGWGTALAAAGCGTLAAALAAGGVATFVHRLEDQKAQIHHEIEDIITSLTDDYNYLTGNKAPKITGHLVVTINETNQSSPALLPGSLSPGDLNATFYDYPGQAPPDVSW